MSDKWKKNDEIIHIHSKWLDLYCETWDVGSGAICEYWRVEKADSVIVVSMYEEQFILPKPMFRPGVGRNTLDFPGGRVVDSSEKGLKERAKNILVNELNVNKDNISRIEVLDGVGKYINSSFNSQRVFVVYAEIKKISKSDNFVSFKRENVDQLLKELSCLQCSYALMQFLNLDFIRVKK